MIFARMNESSRGTSEGTENAPAYPSLPLNVPELVDQKERGVVGMRFHGADWRDGHDELRSPPPDPGWSVRA